MNRNRRALQAVARVLAICAILALFSILPEPLKGRLATNGVLHRLTHIAAFCVGFVVAAGAARRLSISVAVAILLAGFGIALELLQSVVYGNYPEYWDMRDDAWGVALGWLLQRVAVAMQKDRPAES